MKGLGGEEPQGGNRFRLRLNRLCGNETATAVLRLEEGRNWVQPELRLWCRSAG
jgi:hypothetical protein